MPNLVEIIVTAKNLTGPAMAGVNAEVNKAGKGMAMFHKTAGLAAAGIVAIGVESVKMAAKFDSEMTLLQTQAGVSADKIGGLKKGVLSLAGKVGQDPDSLAEALYHVESNFESMGITSAKALKLTETAAKGATIGHADLVDVTNALTAAVASNIPGVQNLDQAMGILNATVGVGDMKMQDLASAFGGGMVATVKGFGLTIKDVGAALAVFGDNNIRGSVAGTQLRMSVMALAKPIQGGADALKSIGLETDTLAKDMQRGGLKLALEDLVAHMRAAGISSKQQGQIITDAFGRKAGSGLNILVGQMDRLESKYPALDAGAKNFGKSWAETQKTFAFQLKQLEMGFQALMIGVGEKLIPPTQAFIHLLAAHKTATVAAAVAMGGLLVATVAVSAAMKAAAGTKLLWSGLTAGAVLAKGAMESLALKSLYMKDAFLVAGGGIKGLGAAFGTLSTGAKLGVAVAAVGALAVALSTLTGGRHAPDVDRLSTSLANLGRTGAVSGELAAAFGKDLDGLSKAVDRLSGGGSKMDKFNDIMNGIFTLGFGQSNSMKEAKKDVDAIDKGLASLVSSGHADQAKSALDRLSKSGVDIPKDKLDDYNAALAGTQLQASLAAESQGRFGVQAQEVQKQLKAQQDVAEGLNKSLQALDQTNQAAYSSETQFWAAIGKATDALKQNGASLDVHTEKGQANRDVLSGIASATDDYTAKLTAQGKSWDTVDDAYKRGYDALVKAARGFGDNKQQADALAKSLLHLPTEIAVKGNIGDLESKLSRAKKDLASAPKSKQVGIRANIAQLENAIRDAQAKVNALTGKSIVIRATYSVVGGKGENIFHEGGGYASGGFVRGGGSGTSDDIPAWLSNGEFVVSAEATRKHRALLEAINTGGHGMAAFAKGGHVTTKAQRAEARRVEADRRQAEQTARAEALGGLSITSFGRMAGYQHSSFENATGHPADLSDLVGSLNEWSSKIRAATHGGEESRLMKDLGKFGAAAIKNEKALSSVNNALTSAKDKLATLKDSFAQLKDSVASNIVAFGSIGKGNTGQPGGPKGVIAGLRADTQQAQRFAADLARLKKMGLNSQSLSELAQAGVEGGGLENAERLLGSSKGDIKEINSLEKALEKAAASAGTTTADAMYGGGIRAADAMVKGLEKQKSRIEKVMIDAADAMAKELKKAFSQRGKASGGTVGAAATGGNRWGPTLVGEYAPELVDLPIGSRVHSGPDTARMLGGAGGGGRPIHLTLELGGRPLARVLIDPLREEIRQLGGDVQAALGRRG
jgi:TP901 family phage tail tape measure protein